MTSEYQARFIRNNAKLIEPDRITTQSQNKHKIRRKLGYIINYPITLFYDSLFYVKIRINLYLFFMI